SSGSGPHVDAARTLEPAARSTRGLPTMFRRSSRCISVRVHVQRPQSLQANRMPGCVFVLLALFYRKAIVDGLATFTISPVGVSVPVVPWILKITTLSLFWFAAYRCVPDGSMPKYRGILPWVGSHPIDVSRPVD